MERRANRIDLVKLMFYILKRAWLVVLLAEIGFGALYYRATRMTPETYTAAGTMYVMSGSTNQTEYQYTSAGDISTAVRLIDTYMVVVKSNKVMDTVTEQLSKDYPTITSEQISPTLSMAPVSETGVVSVRSRTGNAKLSSDIVNAVLDTVPDEIIRVVGSGKIEIIDYATVPLFPDSRDNVGIGMRGAMFGAVLAAAILTLLFMLSQRVTSANDLTENYKPPVLASIQRVDSSSNDAGSFLLSNASSMDIVENYAKLRMNLFYTLVGKKDKAVAVTSSISGEGKSTICANLAISCALSGKKVLLVDSDMRRGCQRDIFAYDKNTKGLSEVLVGGSKWQDVIMKDIREGVDLMPSGGFPPNPAELLGSEEMLNLLKEMEQNYDLILLDMPPINVVADPLVLSTHLAGCLFVARQNFSDHRDIRKALIAAEMTGMDVLGFVFYGENLNQGSYYRRRYYKSYYSKYDYRHRAEEARAEAGTLGTPAAAAETSEILPGAETPEILPGAEQPADLPGAEQLAAAPAKSSYLK